MSDSEARTFSREFKPKAVERMGAGENVSALSRELMVKRGILYRWRARHRAGGAQAPRMALDGREVVPGGLVHHSDRGGQYACGDCIARLEAHGIQPSMSRVGCPYGNAPARAPARAPSRDASTAAPSMAESFIKMLEQEEVEGRSYRGLAEAKASIGSFIEEIHNRQRLRSALGYLSPEEFETRPSPRSGAHRPAGLAAIGCP